MQIEAGELHFRTLADIAREQADVGAAFGDERLKQGGNAGQDEAGEVIVSESAAEMTEVAVHVDLHAGVIHFTTDLTEELAHDAAISGTGKIQRGELSAWHAEDFFHGIKQRSASSASGVEQGSINIEEQEAGHEIS
jgi:hypothetical protein